MSATQRVHDLKVWPDYFRAIMAGLKPFEVRRNDRDFQVGDALRLREWSPANEEYTGGQIVLNVTCVLGGEEAELFGLRPGFVVMGLSCLSPDEIERLCSGIGGRSWVT